MPVEEPSKVPEILDVSFEDEELVPAEEPQPVSAPTRAQLKTALKKRLFISFPPELVSG
jgi:hypothetical protein